MTSENPVENIPTTETTENNLKSEDQPEATVLSNNPTEEPVLEKLKEEEEGGGGGEQVEPLNVEKPKRGGRKKREITTELDGKSEHLNNEHAMDTQPLFEQPIIVEGKRSRKPTSRLELSDLEAPKKEFSIPQGHGKPLGEIEYINHQITHATTDELSHMRSICFGRRGSKTNIRQTLREFNGFEFDKDSDEYKRHLSSLMKLKKDQLRSISDILGLPATGRNDEHAEHILTFLMNPIDEGKPLPERKMSMRTTRTPRVYSKESIHTDEEENEDGDKDDDDDDGDELFNEEDEEEEEENETDDDYIGSDDDSGLITKDDPDDFVYQPGKKTPKKRTSLKRSRSGSSHKRKRAPSKTTKRGRKRTRVTRVAKSENEDLVVPVADDDGPMQTNSQDTDKTKEKNSSEEPKDSDLTLDQSEQNDTPTNNVNVIPTTN